METDERGNPLTCHSDACGESVPHSCAAPGHLALARQQGWVEDEDGNWREGPELLARQARTRVGFQDFFRGRYDE